MIKTYDTKANAKVNIFLRVCGKYENGYHRLLMLMQEIDIGDDIKVSFDDSKEFGIELDCNIEGLDVSKNLCFKAADRFYSSVIKKNPDFSSKFQHTSISTIKRTPSEAGLGGGSSDAASILKILMEHYGNPLSEDEILNLAAGLGADVPFFLFGGSCFCEGIGEIITRMPSLSGLDMILVKPKEGVPTGKCFNLCDSYPEVFDEEKYRSDMEAIFSNEELSPIERIKLSSSILTNDLQKPAMEITPRVREVKDILGCLNPTVTMMSGSGSTVFAIFEDSKKATEALKLLNNDSRLGDCLILRTTTL